MALSRLFLDGALDPIDMIVELKTKLVQCKPLLQHPEADSESLLQKAAPYLKAAAESGYPSAVLRSIQDVRTKRRDQVTTYDKISLFKSALTEEFKHKVFYTDTLFSIHDYFRDKGDHDEANAWLLWVCINTEFCTPNVMAELFTGVSQGERSIVTSSQRLVQIRKAIAAQDWQAISF